MLGKLKIFAVLAVFVAQPFVAAAESVSNEDIQSFYDMLVELDWEHSKDTKRVEIFERVSKARAETEEKDSDKLTDAKNKYEEAKANEQSMANKTLTAATTAATGLGAMELARGLSEQQADKEAEQSMANYIATMRCSYAEGKSVKAGPDEIELPGGNNEELMKYRSEYFALANDLKERKTALGMKPGIESEEILDKATSGLYDDESIGIESGTYASLYRAQMLGSEADQAKIDEEKSASKKRVIGGAVAAGVGILGGIVGNLVINNKSKNKTEREQIASDLNDIMQDAIDICNNNISELKNNIPNKADYHPASLDGKPGMSYEEYVNMINGLQPIKDISEIEKIKDHPACR